MPAGMIGSEIKAGRSQGINNTVTYTIGLCLNQKHDEYQQKFSLMEIQRDPA